MARRPALVALAAAAALILTFSLIGGAAGAVGFTLVAGCVPFALMGLGAAPQRPGEGALPIALCLALVELSLVGMLALRGRVLDGPWLGGLPLAAAFQIYGLFLLPLVVTALGFALTFRRFGVDEADLERLRRLASTRSE